MSGRVDLAYLAQSERSVLLLDGEGVCSSILPKVGTAEDVSPAAARCFGAQFVASLDPEAPGFLGHEPRVGASMLFARVEDGRVALVRFGPIVAFDPIDSVAAASLVEGSATLADVLARRSIPPALATEPELDTIALEERDVISDTSAEVIVGSAARLSVIDLASTATFAPIADDRVSDVVVSRQDLDPDASGEIAITTGTFMFDASARPDVGLTAPPATDDGEKNEDHHAPLRPSGFILRRAFVPAPRESDRVTSPGPLEDETDADEETSRFARATRSQN
jgi:hypothetical protein